VQLPGGSPACSPIDYETTATPRPILIGDCLELQYYARTASATLARRACPAKVLECRKGQTALFRSHRVMRPSVHVSDNSCSFCAALGPRSAAKGL
jgi:hypothetical protein